MRLGNLYAEATASIGLGLIYGPMYPPAYGLTAAALFSCWLTTKFAITFWYRKPPAVNTEMLDTVRFRLSVVLAVAIFFQVLTAWYSVGKDQDTTTLASTILTPVLWFIYEIAPLGQIECLKPVDQFVSPQEVDRERISRGGSRDRSLGSRGQSGQPAPSGASTVAVAADAASKGARICFELLTNLFRTVAMIGVGSDAEEDLSNLPCASCGFECALSHSSHNTKVLVCRSLCSRQGAGEEGLRRRALQMPCR
eukprot:5001885-Prymnesium_polylepis.1